MDSVENRGPSRRKFLNISLTVGVLSGLALSFGQLVLIALRFLYPRTRGGSWLFVVPLKSFKMKTSMPYKTPDGQSVVISRLGDSGTANDFMALSSVCPHLGCKVFWESNTKSFFCPCHNGRFDSQGRPTEGPPAQANQELIRFPLKVENGLLYIRVSTESLLKLSHLRHQHKHHCSKTRKHIA